VDESDDPGWSDAKQLDAEVQVELPYALEPVPGASRHLCCSHSNVTAHVGLAGTFNFALSRALARSREEIDELNSHVGALAERLRRYQVMRSTVSLWLHGFDAKASVGTAA
jgi:hypothetical protein